MTVLSWFELPDEDRPPERIWLDDEALNQHFGAIQERYRSGSGGEDWESIPDAEFEQNEVTAGFRR